jgi:hypothetical protein
MHNVPLLCEVVPALTYKELLLGQVVPALTHKELLLGQVVPALRFKELLLGQVVPALMPEELLPCGQFQGVSKALIYDFGLVVLRKISTHDF